MALARNIAICVVSLSLLVFIAFFGRLPAFRNTPIGYLHRLLVVRIPSSLRTLDLYLTNGRITSGSSRLGHYLMYEKHPVVVIFFLGLVTGSAVLFVPVVWPYLPLHHKALIPMLVPLPHLFTYLSAKRNDETYITELNHSKHMRFYPYDRILYYPGVPCRTCHFVKPARSKHCSICKTCVARMDHHCIWVNNCLGRANYKWFLALLLFTGVLLAYGAYLAYIVISPQAAEHYKAYEQWYRYESDPAADPSSWMVYLDMKLHYFLMFSSIYLDVGGIRAAGVGLLALLTWPLPLALLSYHVYLIWAGMTTNESGKWADWRDDMNDGVVFLGHRRAGSIRSAPDQAKSLHPQYRSEADDSSTSTSPVPTPPDTPPEEEEPRTTWPIESRHILVRTMNGEAPQNLPSRLKSVADEESFQRVWSLKDVENVYDLGFWDNFLEALK